MRPRRNLDLGHRVGAKIRQKRAWIFPGTLWCGRGSTAGDYEQLGMFEPVDRCCREHDHCSSIIRPFTVNFGVLNPTPFTISHCDCDNRFKQCLLKVNDTVSNMVGYTFFNILKLRCFDLIQKSHCTQLNWFGMCTTVRIAPFASLKNPTPYNLTNANSGTNGISDSLHEYQVYSSAKGKEKSMKPKRRKQSNTTETLSFSWKETNSTSKEPTGSPLICDAFRYLDDCKYRIGPMENIYGHCNMESTTIYHCDCIYRFTNNLKQLKKSSILQFLLGKFVSLSCIEISNIKECNKTTGCSAILSKTTELESSLKKMEEDQANTKHIKQLINKRASRKLYKY
ncbi:hypothetical protein MHYP_G00258560 [Metynnis hypsauchen]